MRAKYKTQYKLAPLFLSGLLLSLITLLYWTTGSTDLYARSNATDVDVYVDDLVAPWEDWSYNDTSDFDFDNDFEHTGTSSVAVTYQAFGALSTYTPNPLSNADYKAIEFWAFGAIGGAPINMFLGDDNPPDVYEFTPPADMWTKYTVPLTELGNPATFQRINWQSTADGAQPVIYFDDIKVVAVTDTPETPGFPDTTADGVYGFVPGPSGVAVAPNGRVYAAVYKMDRVFSWPSVTAMVAGNISDKIFGIDNKDPDTDGGCPVGPRNAPPDDLDTTVFCGPESIAVDSNGNLFVADTYNNRVVVFLNPDTDATPRMADAVLGQPDFDSGGANYDSLANDNIREGFCFVRGVAVDADDNLWVVDEFNFRVLRFSNPLTTASLPDKVFGQENLNTLGPGCGDDVDASGSEAADRFSLPLGVAVDKQGNVFVTDYDKDRVLRFAAAADNGADGVIYSNLAGPHDVAIDPAGNLYIADTVNGQLLAYEGGATGDLVPDQTFPGRNFPMGMAFTAGGDLLVADCGAPEEFRGYPPCVTGQRGVYFFAAPEAPQQQAPVAVNDSATTQKNTAVNGNVLTNDTDPQDLALTVSNNTEPTNGTLDIDPVGSFTYTPNQDYVGPDSFTYTVSNSGGLTDTGTVNITVTDEPVEQGEPGLFMPMLSKPES